MRLDELHILNYKNIEQADLTCSPKLNCFVGLNGMGKTNILDAIYFLSFCKSHSNAIDGQNIRHESDYFMIQGKYDIAGQTLNVTSSLKRRQKKHFSLNKKEYSKLSDHIGLIPLVLISPSDIELIYGGSEERRKFIDGIVSQTDKQYLEHLLLYNNALRQRNALLKSETKPEDETFEPWEAQMVAHAQYIHQRRIEFIAEFEPIFQEYYNTISNHNETVALNYQSQMSDRRLDDMLRSTRERDFLIGFTTHGIHKDELDMSLGGYPIKRTGSEGQNKTYLTALKFAQYELLLQRIGQHPLLLLDDMFDKLDSQRTEMILKIVGSDKFGQIFITDTNRNHLENMVQSLGLPAKMFSISHGKVS